tara:strand:+ start:209 stop:1114 length:906 start_codon:yes stop_codon:yes gene_type:complete
LITFITAVGNRKAYTDFDKVEKYLRLTIASLTAQTSENVKIIVVTNELPSFDPKGELCEYCLVDFSPPERSKKINSFSDEQYRIFMRDKGVRLTAGLLFAQQFSPDYVFFLDCDDWLSTSISSFIENDNNMADIYVGSKGYFLNIRDKRVKRKDGIVRFCGSTIAYKNDILFALEPSLNSLTENNSKQDIMACCSNFFIERIMGNHTDWLRLAKEKQLLVKEFPFFTTCWILGTGNNVSESDKGKLGLPLSDSIINEFGISKEFESSERATFKERLIELISYYKSRIEWQKSKKKGVFVYK